MIENPAAWIETVHKAGASSITFHLEAAQDPLETVEHIKRLGIKSGIAIKPSTSLSEIPESVLNIVDLILVMSVEPGFGGQAFMPECLGRIKQLKETLKFKGHIQVDGGVTPANAHLVREAGANVIVSGSGIFNSADRELAISKIRGIK